jgi:hypothetical protein
MQKTFLKFTVFELLERVLRFQLLLNECVDTLHETAPVLKQALLAEADELENLLLSQKTQLNRLFAESAGKQSPVALQTVFAETGQRLTQLTRTLLQLGRFTVEPETYLFLKEALPPELVKDAGEQSVILTADNQPVQSYPLQGVLLDSLPLLQKGNPLAWVTLTQAYARYVLENSSVLETLKLELKKVGKKAKENALSDEQMEQLLAAALSLRLLGPACYFQALADNVLAGNAFFLNVVEPALFFGLNHQNFTHKNLVILHEACEKQRNLETTDVPEPLSEEVLANLFRAIEKAIPAKMAFQEKHFERAIQLREAPHSIR